MRVTPAGVGRWTGPTHQHHLGATPRRAGRHREAHLAAAAISQITDRIQILVGRPGADDDAHAGQIPHRGRMPDGQRGDDVLRLAQPARAGFAFGQRAVFRPDDLHAALAQHREVGDRSRVLPHPVVHGGRDRDWRGGRQAQRGDQIVGESVGQPRQQIGGGRGNQDAIGPAREFDMAHRRFGGAVPETGPDRMAGQGLEAERGDELLGALGHGDLHVGAGVAQPPHQFQRLVRSDAAAHTHQQALALQRPWLETSGHVGFPTDEQGISLPDGPVPPDGGVVAARASWPYAHPRLARPRTPP